MTYMPITTRARLAAATAMIVAAAPVAAQEVTLTLWTVDSGGATGALVEEFNASQDRIKVDIVAKDFSSLVSDAVRAFATGTAPDILEIDNPEVGLFSSRGVLLELSELAAEAENFDVGAMLPGMRAAGTWDDGLYAIPKAANTIALYYNADMFTAAGLDPDQPPQTWSELRAAAEALEAANPDVAGLSFSAAANEEGTFQFLPWVQMGGADYDSLDAPEAVEALAYWSDLYRDGLVIEDAISTGQWNLTGIFNGGGSAMHISGPWELSRMDETAEFDWRVALLPTRDDSDLRSSALGEFMHVVNAETDNAAAAFEFIDWYHSNDADLWNRFGLIPGFTGVKFTPENFGQAYEVFAEQVTYAQVRGPHPEWPRISKAIQTALQSALTGEADPAEAMERAASEVAQVLSDQ